MILHKVKSKNSVSYYVTESFRKPNGGGTSSRVVEKLGTAVELKQRLGDGVDIEQWAPELIKTLRNMNLTRFDNKKGFYTGAFTRTNITEAIHAFAGFRLDCDLLTESDLKEMIKLTKKP